MKNVILTHKELQTNLFLAVTEGLMFKTLGIDLHIFGELHPDVFKWVVIDSCAKCTDGSYNPSLNSKRLFEHVINKGDYQMNDIRIGVTVSYLRIQAEKFLQGFYEHMESNGMDRLAKKVADLPGFQGTIDQIKSL